MRTKSGRALMTLVGIYLIYNGICLINSVLSGMPAHMNFFIGLSVVFIIYGVLTAFYNIYLLIKGSNVKTDRREKVKRTNSEQSVEIQKEQE